MESTPTDDVTTAGLDPPDIVLFSTRDVTGTEPRDHPDVTGGGGVSPTVNVPPCNVDHQTVFTKDDFSPDIYISYCGTPSCCWIRIDKAKINDLS